MSMIPEGLPPTVEFLLREELHAVSSAKELHKRLKKGLLKELRAQAEFTLQKWAYPASVREEPTGDLAIVPSGSMNPVSAQQKCASEGCRIQSARDFARSIGLFADLVVVPDEFSALLLHKHRDGDRELNLFNALSVLAELLPFLREGILRFHRPGMFLCTRCHKETVDQVKEVTRFLMESTAQELHIRLQETPGAIDLLVFNNPLLLDAHGPLFSLSPISKQESRRIIRMYRRGKDGLLPAKATKSLLPYLESGLAVTVREVLTEVTHARHAQAILTTSSRIEAMLLKQSL